MTKQNVGKVVQVIGPVLDIRFEDGQLPELLNAIEIRNGDRKIVAEVAQRYRHRQPDYGTCRR